MGLVLTVFGKNLEREKKWVEELKSLLEKYSEVQVCPASANYRIGEIAFIDSTIEDIEGLVASIDRRKRILYLIVDEKSAFPQIVSDHKVDDVVVTPFRGLEILSKIRYFEQNQLWTEVVELNSSFSSTLQKLTEDLSFAQRLQKARVSRRFPSIKEYRITSRYMAGLRSGGDYFDLAESQGSSNFSIVLSQSSSYGLSSAILSTLMRVAMKVSLDSHERAGKTTETVGLIYDDLMLTLNEKDQLSLFYGILSRHDRKFRYLNMGSSMMLYSDADEEFQEFPSQGGPMTRISGFVPKQEGEFHFSQTGRLILISNGWVEQLEGRDEVRKLCNLFRKKDALDILNEMAFRTQLKFKGEDDMPSSDCTAVIVESNSSILKFKQVRDEN